MPFDEAHVRAIAERIASSLGLEVVDLEYQGGGKGRVLRIFIEKNAEQRRALEQQAAGQAKNETPSPVCSPSSRISGSRMSPRRRLRWYSEASIRGMGPI